MRYLLDTDTFSVLARGNNERCVAHADAAGQDAMALSVISEGEIRYGLLHKPVPPRMAMHIEGWMSLVHRLPLDQKVVPHYASLRAALQKAGTPIGPNDMWIAAHALAEDLTLVTGNTREFNRVPGLRVENWLR